MDKELLLARLQELREQLAENTRKLWALDDLMADGVTDDAVKKYAAGLKQLAEEKETIVNEVRSLLVLADKDDLGEDGMVN